jgi:hypothetical protein
VAFAPSREAIGLSGAGAQSSDPAASPATESDGVDDDESTILLSGFADPQHAADSDLGLRSVLAEPIESDSLNVNSEATLQISASGTNEPSAGNMPWNALPGAVTPSAEELRPTPIHW